MIAAVTHHPYSHCEPHCPPNPMTAEQSAAVSDALSAFDPEAMTEEDALALVAELSEIGVTRGSGLVPMLHEAGFTAREIAFQAGLIGPGAAPVDPELPTEPVVEPSVPGEPMSADQAAAMTDLLTSINPEALTAEDAVAIVTEVADLGIAPGSGLVPLLQQAGFSAIEIAVQAGLIEPGSGGLDSKVPVMEP